MRGEGGREGGSDGRRMRVRWEEGEGENNFCAKEAEG